MESSRGLHVKVVLLKDGREDGTKEIRRFQMGEEEEGDSGGAGEGKGNRQGTLQTLLTRVRSIFNLDPSTQQCTLYWKDDDGDLIRCSRDYELRDALDNMTDGTLRIYVIVCPGSRATEEAPGSSEPPPPAGGINHAGASSHRPGVFPFQGPSPPPPPPPPPPHGHPPHPHHHPYGPPPPFAGGPWGHHGGWKSAPGRGGWTGGWKGGWRGGLYFGCPWNMDREVYGRDGRPKGRAGLFKHGCHKMKMRKMMKMMRGYQMATAANNDQDKEFHEIRQQVPAGFRQWVRQYMHIWHHQGPDAALNTVAATAPLPEGVGQDFPTWLHAFLSRHHHHHHGPRPTTSTTNIPEQTEMDMGTDARETPEKAPECLPPVYYQWLRLFLPRFFRKTGHASCSAHGEEGEGQKCPGGCYGNNFGPRFCWAGKNFGRFGGKHGPFCKLKKGKKHRRSSSSSDSSDSDTGGGKAGAQKVPKGFRKFVQLSFKQLRKGKQGDNNPKIKKKATRAGLSAEVQEFVEQIMLEWNAKVSRYHQQQQQQQQPCALAREMAEAERTLPAGLQREHFLWLVRYMARCQKWQGTGKCGARPAWLSDASSSEDVTSGDESHPEGCPPFHPPMMGAGGHCPPFMGMMGPPPPPFVMLPPGMNRPHPEGTTAPEGRGRPSFPPNTGGMMHGPGAFTMGGMAMPPGMGHPFPPPPPPPYGCCPAGPPGYSFGFPNQTRADDDSSAQKASSTDDEVEHVTEGVKKL